jgi:hypothetical protein
MYTLVNELQLYAEQFTGILDKDDRYYGCDLLHNGIDFPSNDIISIPKW